MCMSAKSLKIAIAVPLVAAIHAGPASAEDDPLAKDLEVPGATSYEFR
jgi:hypothetical protein